MAKKRSGSAKEKLGKTSSVSRSCVSNKPNGTSQRSSRSSPKTTTRSTKRDLKSTRRTRVPSPKESPANRHDCKEEHTKRGSYSAKKRNSSHQEPNESTSKKPKMDSSQVQKEETANSQTKGCSLKGNRKKDGKPKQLPSKEQNPEPITPQIYSKQELTVHEEKKYSKQKSPLKNTHEATPENLQGSPRKDNVVGKRLKLDLVANAGKDMAAKNDAGGSSCDESSDEESVAWEDVDEAHVADHRLKDHETEASTSHQQHSPSKKSVEISITVPGAKKKKKGWNQEDILKYVKRAVNRFRKEVFINVHKVHVLALVAHGMFRNSVCNDTLLQAVLLSHVPNDFVSGNKRKWDVAKLTSFLKWFQSEFTSIDDGRTGEKEADKQVAKLQNLTEVFIIILRALGFLTRLVYSMQPVSAKGDLNGKSSPTTSNKKTLKGSQTTVKRSSKESSKTSTLSKKQRTTEKKGIKTDNEGTTPSSESVSSGSDNKSGSGGQNEEHVEKCLGKNSRKLNNANCAVKAPKRKSHVDKVSVEHMDHVSTGKKRKLTTRPLRKRKRVDYSLSGSNNGSDADEEWNGQSSDDEESSDEKSLVHVPRENSKTIKDKTPLARKKKSTGSDNSSPSGNTCSSLSFVDLMDDDSDFEVTSKPLVKRRASAESSQRKKKVVKMVSSDESDESVKCLGYVSNEQGVNWWAEVYLPVDKKWICAHLESPSINHPELCEKQATQPLVYVVTFDNKSSIKDVTNRYASSWMSKTRKLRIDSDWWEDTLRPYKSKNKKMMEMEDSHLEDQLLDKPLPTSITEYKNHPLYVLKRHLLKFEAIYPETAAILGYCRSEAVYSRECVHTLHTREKWLNEALVVKQGEKAYKVVKGRPKRNQPIHERDSVTIDLFGRWQTEKYKPPPAKDGKVPRNEYGNVELFLPCMLPPGTKHVQINGIHRVAKKLGVDCAQAVVGFDFHCGFSHPVIDGVVVCEEFEQVLLDAWKEEEEQAEKRKAEKREKRMLANWRLLTRSLLIRERLKKRYDTEEANVAETSNDGEDEMITATSISWPLNRQEGKSSVASDGHCHVFPASGHKQDPVTGEWTKSCSCGLTLPFEKM